MTSASIQITKTEDEILKRDLITREISKEFRLLRDSLSLQDLFHDASVLQAPRPRQSRLSNITSYFRSSDKESLEESTSQLAIAEATETPLLRYAFNSFVLEFPFLRYADPGLWHKIQQFLDAYGKLRFGTYAVGKEEASKRERLSKKVEHGLTLLFNTGISTVKDNKLNDEEPKIPEPEKSETDVNLGETSSEQTKYPVSIVSVRRVSEKGLIREKEKPLFILQSNTELNTSYFVGRTDVQIQKYITKVHRLFPTLEIPSPPPRFKDPHDSQLYYEKDRVALQNHLRILVSSPLVARSRLTKGFLSDSPIELLPVDIADKQQREAFSKHRAEEYQKILKVAEDKSTELRESIEQFTREILEPGGFSKVSQILHDVPEISQLPVNYRKMIELARVNLAATLYRVFCADENASINFHQLQQTHGLIPYRTLKGILKISNPTAMMKGILDLFLAQPFGHASIVQRVASANLSDSVKQKKEDIEVLRAAINNDSLCDKLSNYVNSSEDRPYDNDNNASDLDRLVNVIKDGTIEPRIDHETIALLDSAKENLEMTGTAQELLDTDWNIESLTSSEGVEHETIQSNFNSSDLQLRRLYRLLILYTQVRNTELTIELVFEGVTGDILKEILTMFYQPLAQVYKDANISDFVMEISGFVDQLIKVVEGNDQKQNTTPMETLRQFTELVQAYEGTFYRFVHSLYRQRTDGLFQQLISWFERLFTALRVGLNPQPVDLSQVIAECVSSSQQAQFKDDLQALKIYTFETKLRRYKRLRKRMMANMGAKNLNMEESTTNQLTIPSNILCKYMKEAGLETLPDTLLNKLRVSASAMPHSANYSGYAQNPRQFQDLLASSGIQVSIDDMLEMQATESDSDTEEEGNKSASGAPGFLNLEKSNKKITEPKVPYPKLTSIPGLVGSFMEKIMNNLNVFSPQ
ncbi:hypothetical protein K7432_005410 [Basidiobolus ranarum]|uniref:PX domain-containing protein n=1 Tax=Basidiobolus ranarum TaxID=34480 RepID=A0ABR2W3B9_9FUNG